MNWICENGSPKTKIALRKTIVGAIYCIKPIVV